jgi:hypothetical protein
VFDWLEFMPVLAVEFGLVVVEFEYVEFGVAD